MDGKYNHSCTVTFQHEPLNIYLVVRGKTVEFSSGETYTIEKSGDKLEVFGFVARPKRSSATTIAWKHKETGQVVKWHFEAHEDEPEVDASNIIEGKRRRRDNVDYNALDKELDVHGDKQSVWQAEFDALNKSKRSAVDLAADLDKRFAETLAHFEAWLKGSATPANEAAGLRRAIVSGEFSVSPKSLKIAKRVEAHFAQIKVKFSLKKIEEDAYASVAIPYTVWHSLLKSRNIHAPDALAATAHALTDNLLPAAEARALLIPLKAVEVDGQKLKETKIGVQVNKYTRHNDLEISSLAKELIDKWKDSFRKEVQKN